jgi:murein DD-endopeptidase MepM/ murein hydrolase activator NlpD
MTGGTVTDTGRDGVYGDFVRINANANGGGDKGNEYFYARLDSISADIVKGMPVFPGQILGRMGNSGPEKANVPPPVHLHLEIKLENNPFHRDFKINPYPLLRYIEETAYIP